MDVSAARTSKHRRHGAAVHMLRRPRWAPDFAHRAATVLAVVVAGVVLSAPRDASSPRPIADLSGVVVAHAQRFSRGGGGGGRGFHHQHHQHHQPPPPPQPENDFDPYEALGVARDATQAEIRQRYRKISLENHPDKQREAKDAARARGDDPEEWAAKAAERFNKANEAYDILGDEDKRAIFDRFGNAEFTDQWQFEQQQRQGNGRHRGGRQAAQQAPGDASGDFYASDSLVKRLGAGHFRRTRTKPLLVEYYAPWCVHCQQMTTAWKQAAQLLESDGVNVGAVNCERNERLCHEHRIHSYPTIMLYTVESQQQGELYQSGDHSPEALVAFVHESIRSSVVALTDQNFEQEVVRSQHLWIVDYATGWCGPCNALKPELRRFASQMSDIVRVGAVDCDVSQRLCATQQVNYYPFIKIYAPGDKHANANGGTGMPINVDMNSMPGMSTLALTSAVLRAAYAGGTPPAFVAPPVIAHAEAGDEFAIDEGEL